MESKFQIITVNAKMLDGVGSCRVFRDSQSDARKTFLPMECVRLENCIRLNMFYSRARVLANRTFVFCSSVSLLCLSPLSDCP